ncbi:MAG TPA: hypothetical protein VFJ90_17200, partial [Candidatus Didemnitutus sp.]|nr:hypothetical protein [Candidatus Didemnitutus sp.]
VRSGRYQGRQMPPPQIPPPESYARRPVSRDEIRERLAELALRVNRSPQGKLAMLHAVDNGTDRVRALEVLGMNAMVEEDEIGTRERWEQALAAGSKNPAIYHELGTIETRRWFRSFDYYFRLPPARADYLRSLLQRSIEYAPKQSSAYEMLAWVEAAAPEPSVANVNLVQEHFNSLKDKPRTLLALVMVRIRINDLATARSLLDSLEKMPLDEKNAATMTHAIKFVRARLDSRPLDESIETPATETAGKPGLKIHVPVAPPRVEEPK